MNAAATVHEEASSMNSPTGTIVKALLATKVNHVRQAVESYAIDRLDQGKGLVKGYVIGAGLYLAAGIFLIAALFVGVVALFRWIELHYGANIAFGSVGGGFVVLALLCALIGASAMRPPKADFVSLGSRLRVAMRVKPKSIGEKQSSSAQTYTSRTGRDAIVAARNTASAVLRETPKSAASMTSSPMVGRAGAAMALSLLGWALARRYSGPAAVRTSRSKP